MKVLTFDQDLFARRCKELEHKCSAYNPDLVVGIATGGVYVASNMFANSVHSLVTCQRPSTGKKQGRIFRAIVRHLPYSILDLLRMAEANLRSGSPHANRKISLPESLKIMLSQAKRVLIVDDAVDYGATMKSVLAAVSEAKASDAQVRTAAITVTTKNPCVIPDYYLYNNHTLIRFPWSLDTKK